MIGPASSPSLRPVTAEDHGFLLALYATTRAEELAITGWDHATRQRFVEQQFRAQDAHYRREYPGASLAVVELDGDFVGRLYVHRRPREIRIMDLLLTPAARGRGIASSLLRALTAEADATGRPLSLHVDVDSPAAAIYE